MPASRYRTVRVTVPTVARMVPEVPVDQIPEESMDSQLSGTGIGSWGLLTDWVLWTAVAGGIYRPKDTDRGRRTLLKRPGVSPVRSKNTVVK